MRYLTLMFTVLILVLFSPIVRPAAASDLASVGGQDVVSPCQAPADVPAPEIEVDDAQTNTYSICDETASTPEWYGASEVLLLNCPTRTAKTSTATLVNYSDENNPTTAKDRRVIGDRPRRLLC